MLRAFGHAVRLHRQKLGISQEELAERADLHRTYIGDIERGTRNIALKNIVRLASALETTVEDLMHTSSLMTREMGRKNRERK